MISNNYLCHNSSYRDSSLTGSPLVVLVVAPPPVARLIAPLGSAVEPLPRAPEPVQSARIGRIRVVDDAVLENKGAHSRPLAQERRPIDANPPYILIIGTGSLKPGFGRFQRVLVSVVVFDASIALLFLRTEANAKVGIEVAAERRRPREGPSQPPLIPLEFGERSARHSPEHHVVVRQVDLESIEAIGDPRARWTAGGVVGSEHEVVDQELRTPAKEVR